MDERDLLNQATYARGEVVTGYGASDELQLAERALLKRYAEEIGCARLLDIGIGAGRTTGHLSRLAATYTGVDYVSQMVELARQHYPDADLAVADARDLSAWSDAVFDVVVFSFNGIDYVSHEGRLQALAEIRRVLRPGGLLLFSSHNRDHGDFGRTPWHGRPNRATLARMLSAARSTRLRRRLRAGVVHTAEYAIVNDDAHAYGLLTYYISPQEQLAQLLRAGFRGPELHDRHGAPGVLDPTAVWVYYAARR